VGSQVGLPLDRTGAHRGQHRGWPWRWRRHGSCQPVLDHMETVSEHLITKTSVLGLGLGVETGGCEVCLACCPSPGSRIHIIQSLLSLSCSHSRHINVKADVGYGFTRTREVTASASVPHTLSCMHLSRPGLISLDPPVLLRLDTGHDNTDPCHTSVTYICLVNKSACTFPM
jgi:hypothetical protein